MTAYCILMDRFIVDNIAEHADCDGIRGHAYC